MAVNTTGIGLEEMIGHLAVITYESSGYFGASVQSEEGRLLYNVSHDCLMILPKGNRSKGFKVNKVIGFDLIRRDKVKNAEQVDLLSRADEIQAQREQQYQEQARREEEARLRRHIDEQERKQQELDDISERCIALGGYEELVTYILDVFEQNGRAAKKDFVYRYTAPLVQFLRNKAIPNVNDYPAYFFDKKDNPLTCQLIEQVTGVRLGKTQKGNVAILNAYLHH